MGSWGWCECLVFVDCLFPQNGGPRWIFAVFLVRTKSYILKFTVFACLRHGKCISFNVLKRFENCVNTGVFARRWPKNIVYKILQILKNTCAAIFDTRGTKHYKYHGFVGFRGAKNTGILRCSRRRLQYLGCLLVYVRDVGCSGPTSMAVGRRYEMPSDQKTNEKKI